MTVELGDRVKATSDNGEEVAGVVSMLERRAPYDPPGGNRKPINLDWVAVRLDDGRIVTTRGNRRRAA